MSFYIYMGENPTEFVGLEVNIKRHFMIELDEEANAARIAEFLKSGKLIPIPESDFKDYKKKGIDRKRTEVIKYLEKNKHPLDTRTKKRGKGVKKAEEV
jgi:hypothetical protein